MSYAQSIILSTLLFSSCFLGLEKIKLAFEINRLHGNNQNLLIEYANFKNLNLKLVTQFHTENSPAGIEKDSKEKLGMVKKRAQTILIKINEKD
tara:strand:- start:4260 stop:4541 length:282 start_codon:yes stop_codon:yes gene_type:complete